ncbi:MAG: hypothetical protein GC201_14210 [Alphaproteobacteria bacterium]|nr:hypothetical protein [Alphaproteobacteria bacterium]
MKQHLVWVVTGVAVAMSGCGVVYKSDVITSACIASARTFDEVLHAARVDTQKWGPSYAKIEFISQNTGDPQRIAVRCEVDRHGELGSMKVAGIKVDGDQLTKARKEFDSITRSAAWDSKR